MLQASGVETPLTFGILGDWGTGKTSLMHLMKNEIERYPRIEGVKDVFVWFDSWAYARQEHSLWRALLLNVVEELKKGGIGSQKSEKNRTEFEKELKILEVSLYRAQNLAEKGGLKINWSNALPIAADVALRYATSGASDQLAKVVDGESKSGFFSRFKAAFSDENVKESIALIERESEERYVREVKALDDFRSAFKRVLKLANISNSSRRLVVFVDDLDRCLPEDAVAAIEAIKLFLSEEGCVFVLGMDSNVVELGIAARYQQNFDKSPPFEPAQYLDKVIQVPFRIPPLAQWQVDEFLGKLQEHDQSGMINDVREFLKVSVPLNPRTLKRVLNVLLLFQNLMPDVVSEVSRRQYITKLVLLQVIYRPVYQLLYTHGADILMKLEGLRKENVTIPQELLGLEGLTDLMQMNPKFNELDDRECASLINMVAQTQT